MLASKQPQWSSEVNTYKQGVGGKLFSHLSCHCICCCLTEDCSVIIQHSASEWLYKYSIPTFIILQQKIHFQTIQTADLLQETVVMFSLTRLSLTESFHKIFANQWGNYGIEFVKRKNTWIAWDVWPHFLLNSYSQAACREINTWKWSKFQWQFQFLILALLALKWKTPQEREELGLIFSLG